MRVMKSSLSRTVFCVVMLNLLLSGMATAQGFQALREAMTPEELEAAGLNNLSSEQQEFLDAWLRQRFMAPSATVAVGQAGTNQAAPGNANPVGDSMTAGHSEATDNEAMEAEIERRVAIEVEAAINKAKEEEATEEAAREAARDEPFEAEIVGPFSGGSGNTVFTLSNGQVWRQRNGSNYRHTANGQTVEVRKNFMGLWTLRVKSSGRTIGVRRID